MLHLLAISYNNWNVSVYGSPHLSISGLNRNSTERASLWKTITTWLVKAAEVQQSSIVQQQKLKDSEKCDGDEGYDKNDLPQFSALPSTLQTCAQELSQPEGLWDSLATPKACCNILSTISPHVEQQYAQKS